MTLPVVLTSTGARGTDVRVSRDERSRRTADLVGRASREPDDTERRRLLDEVVLLNCRVADAVAGRYRSRGVPLEDLIQVAYEGLVKAVHSFDADRGHDLLTYAVPTIRGEVLRYFRDRSWMVRPPRRVQELQARATAAADELGRQHGREPSHREVRLRLGVAEREYDEALTAFGCFRPASIDRTDDEGSPESSLGAFLVAEDTGLSAAEARCTLAPVLRRLSGADLELLRLRFVDDCTQREIGVVLGLTQTQVSRRMERIVGDLRGWLGEPRRLTA